MAFGAVSFRSICPQIPMAVPASSSSFSTSSLTYAAPRRALSSRRMALPPMPPLNPKDPFLSKLASVAASTPEALAVPPSPDSDTPPFLDIFDSPKLMATPAQVKEKALAYGWFLGDNFSSLDSIKLGTCFISVTIILFCPNMVVLDGYFDGVCQ